MTNDIRDIMRVHQPPIRWWQIRLILLAVLVEQEIRAFEREQKKVRP